jgi:tRNA(Arg) A34 adenosine deaminase TadA
VSKQHELTAVAYDKKGKVICVAQNSYTKTHTQQAHYARRAGKPGAVYLHAEIRAILKANALRKQIHHLAVFRYDRKGRPALAKPCEICQLAIEEHGIKMVTHT